ncbi:hypothetical protein PIB30_014914 [Stylosanthes scabra]|uniref:PROP1-like PPR domain-containing protein n=1 Tax=Stylosanthes scabra TaxID=79078 RepID=A0ABU6U612_9FABA|nr:hypothetical protein [Stylosanthes scabra]
MTFIHQVSSKPFNLLTRISCFRCYFQHLQLIHTQSVSKHNDDDVTAICNSFRRGWSWDIISNKFGIFMLNDSVVERVLLELKDPSDAKCVLGFFHWSTKRTNIEHGIRCYCIAIHILVRARLLNDARALLESVLNKTKESSSRIMVADTLLDCYRISDSQPIVFDLLIQAYAKLRLTDVAFEKSDQFDLIWDVYEHMIQERAYPNKNLIPHTIAYSLIIHARVMLGSLDSTWEIYEEMERRGFQANSFVYTSFIGAYCTEDQIDQANVLMQAMEERGLKPYSETFDHLIIGYANLKKLEECLNTCDKMLSTGLVPSCLSFNKMVEKLCEKGHSLCCCGKLEDADKYLRIMKGRSLTSSVTIYKTLIAGYKQKGYITRAIHLQNEMDSLVPQ